MEMYENANLVAKSLMSYRGLHTPQEMRVMTTELKQYIENNGAVKAGSTITATYSLDKETGISDVQILFPVDKEIPSFEKFLFVSEINVSDCIMARHKGNPQLVPSTFESLASRAKQLGGQIKTPVYNVIVVEPTLADMSSFEIEIYMPLET
jgi:effector-binding domain-containing protein